MLCMVALWSMTIRTEDSASAFFSVIMFGSGHNSVMAESKRAAERLWKLSSCVQFPAFAVKWMIFYPITRLQWINSHVSAYMKRKSGGEAPNFHRLRLVVPSIGGRSQECSRSARKSTSLQRGEKLNHWRSAEEDFCWFGCSWLFWDPEETEKMSPLNLLLQWTVS